jgi:23S rRNA (uracil1939-C5)-methyltransferase
MEQLNNSNDLTVFVSDLSHEGKGIAHVNGKTVFVQNALPGEVVLIDYIKKNRQYDEANVIKILSASPNRISPQCSHYGICGGCHLQHLKTDVQLQFKEKTLLAQLAHVAKVQPQTLLPPLKGADWQYRRRARLAVKYIAKKRTVLVGFREKNGHYLAQLQSCETLAHRVSQLILPLQKLISSLKAYQAIPQIEVALGDETLALVFRHLSPLAATDQTQLKIFAQEYALQLYLQPGNEQTIHCIWPEIDAKPLSYRLNTFSTDALELFFKPHHFIQINAAINQSMVSCAMDLLAPNFSDWILDLFCGLGNFSLPIAKKSKFVIGLEGSPELTRQAEKNAMHNAISNAQFYTADLSHSIEAEICSKHIFNKLLLDPPRSGAFNVIKQIASWKLDRIVYISCNSATLARDTSELVKQGYLLEKAGIIDMFPQTHHSETICLFTK